MLADRFGSRLVVVVGLFLTGLIAVVVGMAGNYWQLLAFLIVMGLIIAGLVLALYMPLFQLSSVLAG